MVGQLAPLFELKTLDAADHKMTFEDLLGKPTVLSFWTTWCPYCLRQTPVLVAGAGRYARQRRAICRHRCVGESLKPSPPMSRNMRSPIPFCWTPTVKPPASYGVDGYPTTYFLDADGRIVVHQIGAMSDEQLTTFVEQLLSEK